MHFNPPAIIISVVLRAAEAISNLSGLQKISYPTFLNILEKRCVFNKGCTGLDKTLVVYVNDGGLRDLDLLLASAIELVFEES